MVIKIYLSNDDSMSNKPESLPIVKVIQKNNWSTGDFKNIDFITLYH